MKNTVKEAVISSLRKLDNLQEKTQQINSKIEKLEDELKHIAEAIEKEQKRIQTLGLKEPSRDPAKPDTPEELQKKKNENVQIQLEKQSLIQERQSISPETRNYTGLLGMFKAAEGNRS